MDRFWLCVIVGIVGISILVAVGIKYVSDQEAKEKAELDAQGLKKVCDTVGYDDYTTFIWTGHVMMPIYHHDPIIKCKIVPK